MATECLFAQIQAFDGCGGQVARNGSDFHLGRQRKKGLVITASTRATLKPIDIYLEVLNVNQVTVLITSQQRQNGGPTGPQTFAHHRRHFIGFRLRGSILLNGVV